MCVRCIKNCILLFDFVALLRLGLGCVDRIEVVLKLKNMFNHCVRARFITRSLAVNSPVIQRPISGRNHAILNSIVSRSQSQL